MSLAPSHSGPPTIDDLMAVRLLGDARLSPDGERLVYAVIRAGAEADIADLWLIPTAGGAPRKLTAGDQADSAPRWSPDGSTVAFLSARGQDAKQQVWRISPDGGEAERLTDAPGGVTAFAWSPDGRAIAYVSPDVPSPEQQQRSKETGGAVEVDREAPRGRLWALDLATGTARQLTGGDRHAVHLAWSTAPHFDWSPDGRRIVAALAPSPNFDDMLHHSTLHVIEAATGEAAPLLERPGSHFFPRWSPDGAAVACFSGWPAPEWTAEQDVWLVPAAGGAARNLTGGRTRGNILDQMAFGLLHWTPDGRALLFADGRGMSVHLFRVTLDGALEQLTQGEGVFLNFSFDRTAERVAYSAQDIEQAPDLQLSRVSHQLSGDGGREPKDEGRGDGGRRRRLGAPRRLTDLNPQVGEWAMGRAEVIRWRGDAGQEIEGLFVTPEGWREGDRPAPLLLGVHGGPQGVTRRNFWLWGGPRYPFPFRLFAALGYALLLPNPRGSGCYAPEFTRANVGDWGGGDYRDIMAGVDHLIAAGRADPERLGVAGWSYGGYMTAWIISQTGRFRAASVGAGPVNPISMYGQTDIPRFMNYYFRGDYWDGPDAPAAYLRHAPLVHAGRIATPLLIHHGDKDERVPLPQGQELYRALRARGAPVEMIVYPGAGHSLTDPRHQRYAMRRSLDWFLTHVPVPAPEAE